MRVELLQILRCPSCGGTLELTDGETEGKDVVAGGLDCSGAERHRFHIRDSVPRFVPTRNYADNFGFQWNKFRLTQLDSFSGTSISRDRFFSSTGWDPTEMAGKRILDVGCGAGRFTEIALSTGAEVVALDYSSAVEACFANNAGKGRLDCIQANIYELPFARGSFDFVYCLGVLQHTPDVERAFAALATQLAPAGGLAVDVYPSLWRNVASGKYWVRPITKRIAPTKLFRLVETIVVPILLPVSDLVARIPVLGRKLRHFLPVSNYRGVFPLSPAQLREWAVLDTYDMLAPAYDQPQSAKALRRWFEKQGFDEVEVFRKGHLIGRGRRRSVVGTPRVGREATSRRQPRQRA